MSRDKTEFNLLKEEALACIGDPDPKRFKKFQDIVEETYLTVMDGTDPQGDMDVFGDPLSTSTRISVARPYFLAPDKRELLDKAFEKNDSQVIEWLLTNDADWTRLLLQGDKKALQSFFARQQNNNEQLKSIGSWLLKSAASTLDREFILKNARPPFGEAELERFEAIKPLFASYNEIKNQASKEVDLWKKEGKPSKKELDDLSKVILDNMVKYITGDITAKTFDTTITPELDKTIKALGESSFAKKLIDFLRTFKISLDTAKKIEWLFDDAPTTKVKEMKDSLSKIKGGLFKPSDNKGEDNLKEDDDEGDSETQEFH